MVLLKVAGYGFRARRSSDSRDHSAETTGEAAEHPRVGDAQQE